MTYNSITIITDTDEVIEYDKVAEFVNNQGIEIIETSILKTNSLLMMWKIENTPFPCIYLKKDVSQEEKAQLLLHELENYFKKLK